VILLSYCFFSYQKYRFEQEELRARSKNPEVIFRGEQERSGSTSIFSFLASLFLRKSDDFDKSRGNKGWDPEELRDLEK